MIKLLLKLTIQSDLIALLMFTKYFMKTTIEKLHRILSD